MVVVRRVRPVRPVGCLLDVTGRPLCECHREPMVKYGSGRWRCAVKNRERDRRRHKENPGRKREAAQRWYEQNRERKQQYQRDYYDEHALKKNQQAQLAYHRNRLVELRKAVTEGGRNG